MRNEDYKNAVLKKTASILENGKHIQHFEIHLTGGVTESPSIRYDIEEVININDYMEKDNEKEEV